MPAFDHAFAGLIADLDQRGLLDSTIVTVTSEFGRTPKINENARPRPLGARLLAGDRRRRHHARADLRRHQLDCQRTRARPGHRGRFPGTVYTSWASIRTIRLMAPGDRPIDIVRDGNVVQGIVA